MLYTYLKINEHFTLHIYKHKKQMFHHNMGSSKTVSRIEFAFVSIWSDIVFLLEESIDQAASNLKTNQISI